MSVENLLIALHPLLTRLATVDVTKPAEAAAQLNREFPLEKLADLRALVRQGVDSRWLCDRENAGVRYSRVQKAGPNAALSIDAVHMSIAGAAHTHPAGEIDLCFAVDGDPRFDGAQEGWVVYPPNSWHIPTVTGGVMDILYFLPNGAMKFGEYPPGATKVGLQSAT
jgi:2-hydroxylaminobenzoate mutase